MKRVFIFILLNYTFMRGDLSLLLVLLAFTQAINAKKIIAYASLCSCQKKKQFIGFSFKFLKLYNPKVYSIRETFVFLTEKNTFRIFISSFYVAFPSCLRREDHICLFFSFHHFSSRGSTRTCHYNVNDPFSDLPFFVSEESICHEITNPF